LNEELDIKTDRLVSMLERERIDAVLLNAQHNFAWLTGGGTNGVDASRENGVASLMVTRDGRRFVLANNIEVQRILAEELPGGSFEPVEVSWQDEKANGALSLEKARSVLAKGSKIAADLQIDAGGQGIENKIASCRHRLTSAEKDRFRLLGRDAGAAMGRAIGSISPGETEMQIAEKLRHELGARGINSVVTLVAADARIARFRHPVPTASRWENVLLLVTCAKRSGLIASLSRIVCAGEIPDRLRDRTEACARVNAQLAASTRPGALGSELYRTAAEAYAKLGFAGEIDLHHQGGATGYKTREWVAHPRSAETVMVDQAFAWNPSITGTKNEETGIVTDNGFEVITTTPDFPQITVSIGGTDFRSPGILSLSKGATA
jgi:antitoxin VapB